MNNYQLCENDLIELYIKKNNKYLQVIKFLRKRMLLPGIIEITLFNIKKTALITVEPKKKYVFFSFHMKLHPFNQKWYLIWSTC